MANGPYRPAFEKYWQTVYIRFSEAAVRRHKDALSRGIINRRMRDERAFLDAVCVGAFKTFPRETFEPLLRNGMIVYSKRCKPSAMREASVAERAENFRLTNDGIQAVTTQRHAA
jgi:hypothetical protein